MIPAEPWLSSFGAQPSWFSLNQFFIQPWQRCLKNNQALLEIAIWRKEEKLADSTIDFSCVGIPHCFFHAPITFSFLPWFRKEPDCLLAWLPSFCAWPASFSLNQFIVIQSWQRCFTNNQALLEIILLPPWFRKEPDCLLAWRQVLMSNDNRFFTQS